MQSNLIFVPYRATERIEFGSALRDIIDKEYYQTPSAFEADIQEVDTLRNDIIQPGKTPSDLALLKRYYVNLSTLESKFPKDVVEFPWFGTLGYRVTGPVKIKSFLFERINIIYNIGALYTQMALDQDRSNGEALKKACLYFQYAATHFAYINKLAEEEGSTLTLPLDLQKGTIDTLRLLCLAQAQELFWQKAFGDKVKDSLIARLALQVSDYYDQALKAVTHSEGFRSEWVSHMTVKKCHFEAAAEYRASLVSVSSSKYGEEVARLQRAQKSISAASTQLKFVSQTVKADFEGLSKTVSETLKRAEKDNDLIYLQDVPTDVTPIVKAPVTKDMQIDEIVKPFEALGTGNYGDQLFKDLLPFYVIQVSHAYRERQAEYVEKHIVTPVRSLTRIIHKFLFERGLPASVDSVDKPLAIPATLLEHSQEVRGKGGVQNLRRVFADIQTLCVSGERLLTGARDRLSKEESEDESLRSRQGSKHWNRPPSKEAASDLYRRIEELEGYLSQAKEGDKVIEERMRQVESPLEILGSEEKDLRKHIPNSEARKLDPSLRRAIVDLKDVLSKIQRLEIEREEFISVVEVKSEQFNILPKIISEYKSIQRDFKDLKVDETTFEPVFSKHIKNFQTDLDFIEKQKITQKKLEDEIDVLNDKFIHLNKSQGSNDDREKVLRNLEAVYAVFNDILDNMSQGLKFYNDLNSKCQELLQDIDAFIYKRRVEARDMEAELNSKFQQMDLNSPRRERSSSPKKKLQTSTVVNDAAEIQRSKSPALIAPRAKPANPNAGLWNPDSGIKFG
ncbi:CYFA0S04e00474g1_1 [Cyberlindnera fabianii]|uniref:CYFA0S04e00474g1_1 n=1 Tax=Cyberlindnera fabianii TaxID=36022 RepID=A0A061AWZ8_CYBFA|nr:CYFA0S04e00474g1_1 [Cyberlindnera fabianii]